MTRNDAIKAMAEVFHDDDGHCNSFSGCEARKSYLAVSRKALSAIEAMGVRLVPVEAAVCGPIGSEAGCSVCERCKAEILLAEAEFREMRLRDENRKLLKWLEVIESHPTGIVPAGIAVESMKKMARNALEETTTQTE